MEFNSLESHKRLPVPLDSGILYTVVAIYYVYVSQLLMKFQFNDIMNLIVSEILFFAVPPFFLTLVRKYDIKKTFRLKAPRPLEALLMFLISPMIVIAGTCSGFIALLAVKAIFGRVYLVGDISSYMSKGLLVSIFLVAVLPAFCEEFLFRGMIQRGMERLGVGWSIFLSGILFGLFHFDFQRLAAQTLIGFIAAYVVYRTGSIFNGMILHFMNNALLTLLSDYSMKIAEGTNVQIVTDPFAAPAFIELAEQFNITLNQLIGMLSAVLSIILAASLLVIFGILYFLRSITQKTVEKPVKIKGSAKGLLAGLPGLFLIAIVYIGLGLTLLNDERGTAILQLFGMI